MDNNLFVAGTLLMSMFMLSSGVSVGVGRVSGLALLCAYDALAFAPAGAYSRARSPRNEWPTKWCVAPCRDLWFAYQSRGQLGQFIYRVKILLPLKILVDLLLDPLNRKILARNCKTDAARTHPGK